MIELRASSKDGRRKNYVIKKKKRKEMKMPLD